MKKGIVLILVVACLYSFGQSDTTQYRLGNRMVMIITDSEGHSDNDWDDFDITDTADSDSRGVEANLQLQFGVNGFTTPEGSIGLPDQMAMMELDYSKSRSFAINTMWYINKMKSSTLFISPGLGLDYNSYFFKNNISISTANDTVLFSSDTITSFKKYKFRTTYLQVPLIVGVRIGKNKMKSPIKLELGAIAGYNIGAMVKTRHEEEGTRYKNKIKDDYNLSPFRLTATARIGIGSFGFFANYAFTPLFEKNKSPELMPFTVGLQIGGF